MKPVEEIITSLRALADVLEGEILTDEEIEALLRATFLTFLSKDPWPRAQIRATADFLALVFHG